MLATLVMEGSAGNAVARVKVVERQGAGLLYPTLDANPVWTPEPPPMTMQELAGHGERCRVLEAALLENRQAAEAARVALDASARDHKALQERAQQLQAKVRACLHGAVYACVRLWSRTGKVR